MNSRRFTDVISQHHNLIFADIFGMVQNNHDGIDLIGDDSGIELKSRLDQHHKTFTIHHYQIRKFARQNPDKELFWGFIYYGLKGTVGEFPNDAKISDYISTREVWFLPWDFAKGRKIHRTKTGNYVYAYLDEIRAQKGYREHKRNGTTLYIPNNSILEERFEKSKK